MAAEQLPARPTGVGLERYREIRSARFPGGLPDRSDQTVIEAFGDAWLLIEHSPEGATLAGVAEDYDAARAWLVEPLQEKRPDGA